MSRLFLFGTLRWPDLLEVVAGASVSCRPATLQGWHLERAGDGDWPVLVPGGRIEGLVTDDLEPGVRARLDWYEVAFGYAPEAVEVETGDGPVPALVYRTPEAGSGMPWDLGAWIDAHGPRTRLAAAEIMRGRGVKPPEELARLRPVMHARAEAVIRGPELTRPVTVGGPPKGDTRTIDRRYGYDGFHRVEEWTLDHPRFDGTRSGPLTRDVVYITDASTVIPYDPARDRVLMVEQVRIGALARDDPNAWLLEPVAGLIDVGETAESSAMRELREEAGLEVGADALRRVGRYYPSPGGITQVVTSFVALCELPEAKSGLHGLMHEGEDIRAHVLPFDEAYAMIASGEAANAPLILTLQWIALHREALRASG